MIGAYDSDGHLTGCVVNYAATLPPIRTGFQRTGSTIWSVRFNPFSDRERSVFLQGFCGDITQVDNRSPWKSPTGEQYARLVGGSIGAEVVKVLSKSHAGAAGPTSASSEVISMNRRLPSRAKVQQALATVSKDPKEVGTTNWIFAKKRNADALAAKSPKLEVEVQAIQVGPAVMVSAPGEDVPPIRPGYQGRQSVPDYDARSSSQTAVSATSQQKRRSGHTGAATRLD